VAEADYNRQCYRDHTRDPSLGHYATQVAEDMETSEDVEYRNIECDSYEELFRFIRAEVLDTPDAVTLNSLIQKLTQLMQSNGVACVRESTKTHKEKGRERVCKQHPYISR